MSMPIENLAEYFDSRRREQEELLQYVEAHPEFRLWQHTTGGDQDITEQYKQQIVRAIEDYRKAAEMCRQK